MQNTNTQNDQKLCVFYLFIFFFQKKNAQQ